MPRILTAETTPDMVLKLKRTAKENKRSAGQEALVAIENHIKEHRERAKAGLLMPKPRQ